MATTVCGIENSRGMTYLREDPATPDTFVEIGGMQQMPEPAFTATLDSCNDPYGNTSGWNRQYHTGSKDGGTIAPVINMTSGNPLAQTLYADFNNGVETRHRIVYPDGTEMTFPTLISGYSRPAPGDGGKLTINPTVVINGEPVWS